MSLYLICKNCGREFSAGVDMPPPEPRPHHCTHCTAAPVYEPADFRVPAGYAQSDLDSLGQHG
ncbi:MAG: hypothetical protein M3P85_13215 [Actinomycetota bacterium]|nr:hypothetical protein [Actinomycetota bacterium]PLS76516.1 MAG: hypothetical protein CYG61_01795 [Actinomycetota bacterium]